MKKNFLCKFLLGKWSWNSAISVTLKQHKIRQNFLSVRLWIKFFPPVLFCFFHSDCFLVMHFNAAYSRDKVLIWIQVVVFRLMKIKHSKLDDYSSHKVSTSSEIHKKTFWCMRWECFESENNYCHRRGFFYTDCSLLSWQFSSFTLPCTHNFCWCCIYLFFCCSKQNRTLGIFLPSHNKVLCVAHMYARLILPTTEKISWKLFH